MFDKQTRKRKCVLEVSDRRLRRLVANAISEEQEEVILPKADDNNVSISVSTDNLSANTCEEHRGHICAG